MTPGQANPTSSPSPRRRVPRSPSPRSVVHVPPPRSPAIPALSFEDAERDRQERFHGLEGQHIRAAETGAEGEDLREAEFRRNEDERQRVFLDHEHRRDEQLTQRRDQIWHDLEDRLATLPPSLSESKPMMVSVVRLSFTDTPWPQTAVS
jgi:hypothetical protein